MIKRNNSELNNFIKNTMINSDKDYFYELGYKCLGPILYSFSVWLKKEIEKEKIKGVYFLSRDGYVMKKAFDLIYNDGEFDTYYLYSSRRAAIVPSLWKLNNANEVFDVINFNKKISIKSIIKRIGLEDFDLSKQIEKYHLDIDKIYDLQNIKENENFKLFLNDIFPQIKANSEEEWKFFNNYLTEMNFFGKVAIIDIGWVGSMQKAIKDLKNDAEIFGYYIGLNPNSEYYDINYSKGFIFDKSHNMKNYSIFYNFINIFEFMTLAQHGSVKRFHDSVELYPYEYLNMNEEIYSKILQKGALDFIENFVSYNNKNILDDMELAVSNLVFVCTNPKYKDSVNLGNLKFDNDEYKCIAKPKSVFYYFFHIKELKKDFDESTWKIGFLKRLLKIKLPYYYIVSYLRDKKSKK